MEIKRIPGFGWRLIFVPGLRQNFDIFRRCVDLRTYREGSNNFFKGQIIDGHFLDQNGTAAALEVLEDTKMFEVGLIPDDIRNEWGQAARDKTSLHEMMETMRGYYSDLTHKTRMSVNFLRYARFEGRLVRTPFPEDLRAQTEYAQGRK